MTNRAIRKIDAMYHFYGHGKGKCKDCPHFSSYRRDRIYHKCEVYGVSASEATDWRCSYSACGLYDKPFPNDEIRIVKRLVYSRDDNKPIKGQISIFDMEEA